jgi:heme-degrading monooxygenase HmoA
MHLAQLNIGRLKGGKDDPRMADFFANLDRINAMAERMPGFVWRLKDEPGEAMMSPVDPTMVVNLTVWESAETLEKFVWQTAHAKIYARKHEWFETPTKPILVMWWIEEGHIPTLDEAQARLDHYTANGGSEFAFGWADLPSAKLWLEKRCA